MKYINIQNIYVYKYTYIFMSVFFIKKNPQLN